jgi:iron complex outermembrane receptor protein
MKTPIIAASFAAAAILVFAAPAIAQGDGAIQASGSPAAPAASEASLDLIPLPGHESDPAPARQAEPRESTIEEVIVTAQRKEQSAQDVPVSITVFNQQQLSNANITNSSDLATYTPSLSTNQRFGSENATFSIRGFTQELRTTASVATYFAEVVAPRGQSSQSSGDGAGPGTLFDLQNVQVLKGPQGTLFGRNTTGGAVLIVPKKPTDYFEGYVELSGGDFDAKRAQAVVNVPLADTLKMRLGVDRNKRDGYLINTAHIGADDLGNTDYTSGRFSLVWNITEELENYTILSGVNSDTNGYTTKLFACNFNPAKSPLSLLTGPPCLQQLAREAAAGQDGYYDLASTIATPTSVIKERRAINTTTWQAAEDLRIKNILAYSHLYTENGSSIFGTQFHLAADLNPQREFVVGNTLKNPDFPVTSQESWVEELQLQGSSLDGDLEWQSGVYYERSNPDGFSGNSGAGLISCELSTLEGEPSQYNCFDPTAGLLGLVGVQKYKTRYTNRAVYSEATYKLLEPLSITAGLRYTWDRTEAYGVKTLYTFAGDVPRPPTETTTSPEVSSKAPTGQIQLSYKPMRDVMAYAKYVRGYRQGSVVPAADAGVDTFKPEKVNTYEIGAKTTFAGPMPGRFNIAAFYNDFTDQQLQAGYLSPNSGPTTSIFNAGKSRIYGVEVESFFQLFRDLTLGISYSHLDTKLLEQEDHKAEVLAAAGPEAAATYTPIADTGDTLPFAADDTVVTSLTYSLPLPAQIGAVDFGVTYVYTGSRRAAATSASPYAVLDPFQLLNLNLNWTGLFGTTLDLSAFATNVLDEKYETYVGGTYNALGFESRQTGQPRMIGARLKYNFGR